MATAITPSASSSSGLSTVSAATASLESNVALGVDGLGGEEAALLSDGSTLLLDTFLIDARPPAPRKEKPTK